jgi:MoxR-like ATPase
MALRSARPILLEGEPGVGKTQLARTLAKVVAGPLIRLQCYEGIDASQALYDWDFARQLLFTRVLRERDLEGFETLTQVYGTEFLVERPVLQAVRTEGPRVLLVDELDRGDDEFDAFLLEFLDDYGMTIPEIGRIEAATPPIVVLTSNRTRELHDAVKRRCLYHWIEYPDIERETRIIRLQAPEVDEQLAASVARSIASLRTLGLHKPPGAAEAIDWARALALLGARRAEGDAAVETSGWVIKDREDQEPAREHIAALNS